MSQVEPAVELLHIRAGYQLGRGTASSQKSPCFPWACGAHLNYMEGLRPQTVGECVHVCVCLCKEHTQCVCKEYAVEQKPLNRNRSPAAVPIPLKKKMLCDLSGVVVSLQLYHPKFVPD